MVLYGPFCEGKGGAIIGEVESMHSIELDGEFGRRV